MSFANCAIVRPSRMPAAQASDPRSTLGGTSQVGLLFLLLSTACVHENSFTPAPGYQPISPPGPDVGLVFLVDFTTDVNTQDQAAIGTQFEVGIMRGLVEHGYRPIVVDRRVAYNSYRTSKVPSIDDSGRILAERADAISKATTHGLATVVVAHLMANQMSNKLVFEGEAPDATMTSRFSMGATCLAWGVASSSLFFKSLKSDHNWFEDSWKEHVGFQGAISAEFSVNGNLNPRRVFIRPPGVLSAELSRALLAAIPSFSVPGPDAVEPLGFPVPAMSGHQQAGEEEEDLSPDLFGKETRVVSYQDGSGNRFSTLSTNGKTWGWKIVPVRSVSYLLVDSTCNGRPTTRWPAEQSQPTIPACAKAPSGSIALRFPVPAETLDPVEVRGAPFPIAPIIARLGSGERVMTAKDVNPDGWRSVRLFDGRTGFVKSAQFRFGLPAQVDTAVAQPPLGKPEPDAGP